MPVPQILPRPPRRASYRRPPLTSPIRHRRAKHTPAYRAARRERVLFGVLIVGFAVLIAVAAATFVAMFTFAGGIVFAGVVLALIVGAGVFQIVHLFGDGGAE